MRVKNTSVEKYIVYSVHCTVYKYNGVRPEYECVSGIVLLLEARRCKHWFILKFVLNLFTTRVSWDNYDSVW